MTRQTHLVPYLALLGWLLSAPAAGQFLPPDQSAPPRALVQRPPFPPAGPRPGGGPPGYSLPAADPLRLLANSPAVQKELALTEEQIRRLQETEQRFREAQERLARESSPAERAALAQQVRAQGSAIDQILQLKQLQRLQQIMLQQSGPCLAIHDPYFISKMALTAAQTKEIQAICRRMMQDMRQFGRTAGKGNCRQALAERTRAERLQLQTRVHIESLLSPSQRQQLAKLEGAPIRLEPQLPPACRQEASP